MSTTGYLATSMYFALYFFFQVKSYFKYPIFAILCYGFSYVYFSLDFLSEKIEGQNESAISAQGDFDFSRLGSFLFDMEYVEKHPLVGNGLNGRTLYADHQWLVKAWEDGDVQKNGNGLSNQMARFGIFFFPYFFYLFYRNNRQLTIKDKSIFTIIYLMLLFGEPLLNYPFGLGIPFMNIVKSKGKKI